MKKMHAFIFSILLLTAAGCKKYLEAQPDQSVVVARTIQDAQALMDIYSSTNGFYANTPAISDDDYYLADTYYNSIGIDYRDLYTWKKDGVTSRSDNDWSGGYANLLKSNLALEVLGKITPDSSTIYEWKRATGGACFLRAWVHLNLVQVFAKPYDKPTAAGLPGIHLRMSADVNETIKRSSLEACYEQIISDFKAAAAILPPGVTPVARPTKAAAYGALSRVYLVMEDYVQAGLYADSCLQLQSTLMDYNSISTTATLPFKQFNAEVIFPSTIVGPPMLNNTNWRLDSSLYLSYAANDLRKALFFKANGTGANTYYTFKGSYEESTFGKHFLGLATDEIYLMKAECKARAGDVSGAMQALNVLLIKRWKTGTFVPYTAANAEAALRIILLERRKELVARSERWFDLRRLNKDTRFAVTLKRKIGSQEYSIPPNDKRYTFLIPQIVIDKSGLEQNER